MQDGTTKMQALAAVTGHVQPGRYAVMRHGGEGAHSEVKRFATAEDAQAFLVAELTAGRLPEGSFLQQDDGSVVALS